MKRATQFKKTLALLLCGVACLALLAGCVTTKAKPADELKPESSAQTETSTPDTSEPVSDPAEESSGEASEPEVFVWDVKPFDWDAVIALEQTEEIVQLNMDAVCPYHSFNLLNKVKVWVDEPDTLTWVYVWIPRDDYDDYRGVEVTPAKERAAHLFALLDENDRRYAFVSYDDEEYEMCVPISYNEILELSEFGGYFFACTHCPRTEDGPWMKREVRRGDEGPYFTVYR